MELETLERKKSQVEEIAKGMVEGWRFARVDGVLLSANAKENSSLEPIEWTGSSTWLRQRWIRDENRPDQLDYIVKTVVWRPDPAALPESKEVDPVDDMQDNTNEGSEDADRDSLEVSEELERRAQDLQAQPRFGRGIGGVRALEVEDLRAAEVPEGTPGQEANEKVREWREAQRQAGQTQNSAQSRLWAVRGQMMGRLRRMAGQNGDETNNG